MNRRHVLAGSIALAAVVAGVVVLRQPPPPPPSPPPPAETVSRQEVPLTGREVSVPAATGEILQLATTDGRFTFFETRGDDGFRRLVAGDGTELWRGSGSPAPLTGALDGTNLVATEVVEGATIVSTKDLVTGDQRSRRFDYEAAQGTFASAGNVLLQQDTHCTATVNLATMSMTTSPCDQASSVITLVTAESDGLHWHETKPDGTCGGWFRLNRDGVREQLNSTEVGCQAVAYVRSSGWDVTATTIHYTANTFVPGSLTAHRGNREILLDTAQTTDLHACGDHVYWLSPLKPRTLPRLNRWRPGETTVAVLGAAQSPRCVNGVLTYLTYNKNPHLWVLSTP